MPRYQHDCSSCIFLETSENYDLYFCPKCDGGSVVCRYGDEGSEYASGPWAIIDQCVRTNENPSHYNVKALALIEERGLYKLRLLDKYRRIRWRMEKEGINYRNHPHYLKYDTICTRIRQIESNYTSFY